MEPRLKNLIMNEINPSLKEKFGYKSLYMGPKIEKVVLNMGLGLDGNDANAPLVSVVKLSFSGYQ